MIIQAITTNKGKTIDRYTVYFYDGTCLTVSDNPDNTQGFSQWSDYYGYNDSHFEDAAADKKHKIPGTDEILINWFQLPVIVQAHIEGRINEAGE